MASSTDKSTTRTAKQTLPTTKTLSPLVRQNTMKRIMGCDRHRWLSETLTIKTLSICLKQNSVFRMAFISKTNWIQCQIPSVSHSSSKTFQSQRCPEVRISIRNRMIVRTLMQLYLNQSNWDRVIIRITDLISEWKSTTKKIRANILNTLVTPRKPRKRIEKQSTPTVHIISQTATSAWWTWTTSTLFAEVVMA